MAESHSFKLYFEDQIRRLRVPAEKCNWEEFGGLLESTYGDTLYHGEMSVTYLDTDGDRITVNSQPEWEAMLQHLGEQQTICLQISEGRNFGAYFKDGPPAEIVGLVSKPSKPSKPEQQAKEQETPPGGCPLQAAMEVVGPMARDFMQGMFAHGRILPENLPEMLQQVCQLKPLGTHEYEMHVNLNGLFDGLHKRALSLMGPDQPREKCEEARCNLRMLVTLSPYNTVAHYNLGCAEALCQRPDAAVAALRKSIALGYVNFAHMRTDEDLASLRTEPAFQALLREFDPQQPEVEVETEVKVEVEKSTSSAAEAEAAAVEEETEMEVQTEANELSAVEAHAILDYTMAYHQLLGMGFPSREIAEHLEINLGSMEITLESLMALTE
jgi:PB1 domain